MGLLTTSEWIARQIVRDVGDDPDEPGATISLHIPGRGREWRFVSADEAERLKAQGIPWRTEVNDGTA